MRKRKKWPFQFVFIAVLLWKLYVFFSLCVRLPLFWLKGIIIIAIVFILSLWTFDGADFINDCDYFRFVLALKAYSHHSPNNANKTENRKQKQNKHKQKNNNYWETKEKKNSFFVAQKVLQFIFSWTLKR